METIQNNRKLIIFEGIVLIILGLVAIAIPTIFTLTIELLIGWLFLIARVVQGYRSFKSIHAAGFWPSLIGSLVAIIVGVLLLMFPLKGVLTLTLILSAFFIIEGLAKITLAITLKDVPQWGWILVSGILALGLAALIWYGWPSSAYWVIGLLVGINLLFFGCSLLALGIAAGKQKQQ